MFLQIVVVFRILLQFTCIIGCLMGFLTHFPRRLFSPSFFNRCNIRCKEEETKGKGKKKGKCPNKRCTKVSEIE